MYILPIAGTVIHWRNGHLFVAMLPIAELTYNQMVLCSKKIKIQNKKLNDSIKLLNKITDVYN